MPAVRPLVSSSGQHDLLGRAGPGGRLQDDQGVGRQVVRDHLRGRGHRVEVRAPVLVQRRRDADDHGVGRGEDALVRGRAEPLREEVRDVTVADVVDVGEPRVEEVHARGVDVEADDAQPVAYGLTDDRHPHISEPHHGEVPRLVPLRPQSVRITRS